MSKKERRRLAKLAAADSTVSPATVSALAPVPEPLASIAVPVGSKKRARKPATVKALKVVKAAKAAKVVTVRVPRIKQSPLAMKVARSIAEHAKKPYGPRGQAVMAEQIAALAAEVAAFAAGAAQVSA